MEFWGVEVESGKPLSVEVKENKVLHLSQASLGEVKKGKSESVCMHVEIDGKKLVLGTLISETLPQQLFDIVFNKDFVLSHNWKNGSIYFYGYIADDPSDGTEDEFGDESDSEDEAIPLQAADNGKVDAKPKKEKKAPESEKANAVKDSNAGKQKVKIVEPSVASDSDDDMDDDSDDAMPEDDGSDSEGDDSSDDEDDSDDDEDSDDEEETPQMVQIGKKRPSESATKTPVPDKKAKLVTPTKTDGKKGGVHVATPHPSKQAEKAPATNKSNKKSPKTGGGSVSCQPCKKNFNSDVALSAHNKAKHGAK